MGIKKLSYLLLLLLLPISCNADNHAFKTASEEVLFKNFALSICLGMAYTDLSKKFTNQASSAANGYREYSHISLEAYEEARAVVKKWLKKDYKSKQGGQIQLMKCIDLYNHSDLRNIFAKYNPCKSPDSWLDRKEFNKSCK